MRALQTALVLPLAMVTSIAAASTYRVPADHPTIQDALNVSGVGDTVLVAPGTYSGHSIFLGDATVAAIPDGVVLISEAGAGETVVDLAPLEGVAPATVAFSCSNHTSGLTVIDGFHVIGFHAWSAGVSAGYCAKIEIRGCVFDVEATPDPSVYRKGISLLRSDALVHNCTFIRCSGSAGAGISHTGGALTVETSTFIDCQNQAIRATDASGGGPHRLEVRDCVFQGIRSDIGAAGVGAQDVSDGVVVHGCRFENLSMGGSGTVTIAGPCAKTVSNCVFYDIDLTSGNGGCIEFLGAGVASVTGNTCAFVQQASGGAAVEFLSVTEGTFENNIVAHTTVAQAVWLNSSLVTSGCNVFWDNPTGIGYPTDPTDRVADPQFCDPENGDLTLQATSPCVPELSLGCGLIGALDHGCGSVGIGRTSWAKTKAAYR